MKIWICGVSLGVSALLIAALTGCGEDTQGPGFVPGGGGSGATGTGGAGGEPVGGGGSGAEAGGGGTGGNPYDRDAVNAVDIVILVDNSGSMAEEQTILATQFFNLVNALVDPPVPGECLAVENVRIGVITSDMGLQSGANGDLPDPHPFADQCLDRGDEAAFQTYGDRSIDIQPGVIACNESGTQCPSGWECMGIKNGVGSCRPGSGDGSGQKCPALGKTFAETKVSVPNKKIAFQTACLAKQGTEGCGFEQQLKALTDASEENADFLRDEALLALIVVSDEEDCSIEDVGIFGEPEFGGATEVNLVCGRHKDRLYSAQSYQDQILNLKGGKLEDLVFASIVGVPIGDECEGLGDSIADCLQEPDMKLTEIEETSSTGAIGKHFAPACTRYVPADSTDLADQVTKARPGRRYVQLAQSFGGRAYVSSICNKDWTGVMEEIARLIACNIID